MTELESTILSAFLSGDSEELALLRHQLAGLTVRDRSFSGAGFFTDFSLAAGLPRLRNRDRIVLSDVAAEVSGLEHGAGFLLFVEDGAIDCLEGFSYGEAWPTNAVVRRWFFLRPVTPGSPSLVETSTRDLEFALSRAAG